MNIRNKLFLILGFISLFPVMAVYITMVGNPRVVFALRMNEYEAQQDMLVGRLQADTYAIQTAFERSLTDANGFATRQGQPAAYERQRKLAATALSSGLVAFDRDLRAISESAAQQGKDIAAAGNGTRDWPGLEYEQVEAQLVGRLRDTLPYLQPSVDKYVRLSRTPSSKEIKSVQTTLEALTHDNLEIIQELAEVTNKEAKEDRDAIQQTLRQAYRMCILVVLVGLAITVILAALVSSSIVRSIRRLRDSVREFGSGDTNSRIQAATKDELGDLPTSFNRMADELQRLMKDISFQNALLKAQAETTIDGILAVDTGQRIILSNQQFANIWKVPGALIQNGDDQVVLRHVLRQVENPEQFLAKVEYLYAHEAEKSKDEIRLVDGRVLDRYSSPLIDAQGGCHGRIWYFRDITERIKAEERLQVWSQVLQQSAEGILICDHKTQIVQVNSAFEQLTGMTAAEAIGRTPSILQSGLQDKSFYEEMWKTLAETGVWRGEMWNRRKNGEIFAEWLSISTVYDQRGAVSYYVGIFSDVTARKRDQERIVHMAQYDALTDLPNRVLLFDRLERMIATAERRKSTLAVVFIDFDHFKDVNDSLGHSAGDLLLQTLAKRLSGCVRKSDTLARMGGDEFVLLIQDINSLQDVEIVADKILSCFRDPIRVLDQDLTISASLGISLYPEDGKSGQDLVRNADAAMYQAKRAGRNCYHLYTSDLHQRARESLSVENALRRAIEREEFILHYQPQININSGCIVGAEALIRWNHPDLDLVLPGQFIPIAEERGLIISIGNWSIDEAVRQASAWKHLALPIAVNVSAIQFRQKNFVEYLLNTVQRHGIAPDRIELELTESIIMRDAATTIDKINRLHEFGFRISLDDFGTGYSSLNYLRRFQIDKIKIDKSFIGDHSAVGIVSAIIGLSHNLELGVIAEGVETLQQLKMLRELGCDEAQGFFFAPGLTASDFEKLVARPSDRLAHVQ